MLTQHRDLFGGAIKVELPAGFVDASEFRQVPDNQEVLLRQDCDVSLIVEVLQLVTDQGAGESLEKAIKFHFESLAHDNSASSSRIDRIRLPSTEPSSAPDAILTPAPATLVGSQVIKKFGKSSEPDQDVRIYLALWRLPNKNVDLVMSINEPTPLQNGDNNGPAQFDAASVFDAAAASLSIQDWSLFA